MSLIVTPGQRADCTQFKPVLERIRVPRIGPGRPRRKPDSLATDRAYSNGPCREYLYGTGASDTRFRRRPTARPPAYAKERAADGHPASTKNGTRNATPLNGRSTGSSTPEQCSPATTSAVTSTSAPRPPRLSRGEGFLCRSGAWSTTQASKARSRNRFGRTVRRAPPGRVRAVSV
ncbi:transposase [Streptomyces flaveolus]|uniref:transposase n=1 Tax=Streptomyces flaveolus TaxID=67297 RepID=UPI00343F3731